MTDKGYRTMSESKNKHKYNKPGEFFLFYFFNLDPEHLIFAVVYILCLFMVCKEHSLDWVLTLGKFKKSIV